MKAHRIFIILFTLVFLTITAGSAMALPQQADSVQTKVDSTTKIEKQNQSNQFVLKEALNNNDKLFYATFIASLIMLLWALVIIFYFRWAIRFYTTNWGLSDHEWRLLFPEVYACELRWWNRLIRWTQKSQQKFAEKRVIYYRMLHNRCVEERRNKIYDMTGDYQSACKITLPFDPPKKNPHSEDSFGLPKNTIRGTLALSTLVLFILIESVNLYTRINLEFHFEGLITALKMVLAFYFGSKAVDALKVTETNKRDIVVTEIPQAQAATPPDDKKKSKKLPPEVEELPNEQPAMPSRTSSDRVVNVIENLVEKSEAEKKKDAEKEKENKKDELAHRVLSLTASFETSRSYPDSFAVVTGNFDGQGLSFGALQWCIGQGSLQPLLKKMHNNHDAVMKKALGDTFYNQIIDMLNQTNEEQLNWAKSIQLKTTNSSGKTVWRVTQQWREKLAALGKTEEMIAIQVEAAMNRYQVALENCKHYKVGSERAVALMFDINVQNGIVGRNGAGDRIFADYDNLSPDIDPEQLEIEKLKIIAKRRAEVSSAQWRQDVLTRKLTIAEGTGKVHGMQYDLATQYNIGMKTVLTA